MKKNQLTTTIGAIALAMAVINCKASVISFAQEMADAGNVTLSVSPAYAPEIKDDNGDKAQWGVGVSATYTLQGAIGQYTFTGVRVDYLGGQLWAPSVTGGLKADVTLFDKVKVTPIAYTGMVFPLSDWKQQAGSVGIIAGGGLKVGLYSTTVAGYPLDVFAGVAYEHWAMQDGSMPGAVYRGFFGVKFAFKKQAAP